MKETRLAYIIPTLSPGGAEYQTINQINYMYNTLSINVYLIVIHDSLELFENLKIPNDRVCFLGLKKKKFNHRYVFSVEMIKVQSAIAAFIVDKQISTIIAVLNQAHFLSRLSLLLHPRLKKVKLFTYYRNVYFQLAPLTSILRKAFNQLMSLMARRDSGTIFISEAVKFDICSNRYVAPKQVVIHNSLPCTLANSASIDRMVKQEKLEPREYNILFPGRLHMQKGHLDFLDVYTSLIQNNKLDGHQVHLFLAGDGPEKGAIKKRIEQNSIKNYVTLLGFVSNDRLLALMQWCDLVVIPSKYEGFGNVAIEALSQGAMVLASTTGGLPEIIQHGENGFLFEKENEEDLYDKLFMLYSGHVKLDPELLIQNFRARFTIKAQVEKLLKIIK